MNEALLFGIGVLLTLGTALFVAAEFALVTLDPGVTDQQLAGATDKRSRNVLRSIKTLSTQLSGAQVGITLTTILFGYVWNPPVSRVLAGWFGSASAAVAGALTAVGTLLVVNGFSMLFGELIPKNLALSVPLATARAVSGFQLTFTAVLRPVISALNGTANWILRAVGVEPREELAGGRSPQELAALVRRSAEEGTLDVNTATLITNSLDFAELTAIDVMTDRGRMRALERDETAADVIAASRATGHSRFPVYDETVDDVVGLVHLKRAVGVPFERRGDVPVAALMVEAPRVPETVGLDALLVELRGFGLQMAVVVDEYGGTSGVVTLEDVVEELVGEVSDEHDPDGTEVAHPEDDVWIVPGVTRPDELAEIAGIVVPDDGPYETLGGLVMAELGRIPVEGDEVRAGSALLRVTVMSGRRVARLRVSRLPAEDES